MEQPMGAGAAVEQRGMWAWLKNKMAIAPLIGEYYVPEERTFLGTTWAECS